MPAAPKKGPEKITLRQLREMLRSDDVDDAEIRPYLRVDPERSIGFAPHLEVDPELVDDEGQEGDVAVSVFNWFSKRKRQRRYRRKVRGDFDGVRIVSEGDSWFQYPILLDDVIDELNERPDLAVFSLGGAGHLLVDMIAEDEITGAIEAERPDFFLISGGGNDLVGDGRLATMLHPYSANRAPENYLGKTRTPRSTRSWTTSAAPTVTCSRACARASRG